MQPLAIALIVVGALVSAVGIFRVASSRRQVLAPGEVGSNAGKALLITATGDAMIVIGILLLVL